MALIFPNIDPAAVRLGPLVIRWYALAYLAGLLLGKGYIRRQLANPRIRKRPGLPTAALLEDLLGYVALGVILGGRLGYILFYKPSYYWAFPSHALRVWEGGMSFHGGLLGTTAAMALFARKHALAPLAVGDAVAVAVPIGLFFGRIANFINAELWGRVSDVPWAVRFPVHGAPGMLTEPRHPSQLYEAFAEGALLFFLMSWLLRRGAWQHPGRTTGAFLCGYAAARTFCEFWREPDSFLGFVGQIGGLGLTQGMALSLPPALAGAWLLWRSGNRRKIRN